MVAKHKDEGLSIVEAIETLSSIAEMDFDKEMGVTEERDLNVQDTTVTYRTVHWLQSQSAAETLSIVKEIFCVLLDYLGTFYRDEYHAAMDKKKVEGIKAIMVLVGEAAKKLDRYTVLFLNKKAPSVTQLKEYRDLQRFYQNRISRKVDESLLGKWILGLAKQPLPKEKERTGKEKDETEHLFVDLESVKRDTEYELFFMRKKNGSRFFNPSLIRNMKLVSDFGDTLDFKAKKDPILDVEEWTDRCMHLSAQSILKSMGSRLEHFYHETAKYRGREFPGMVMRALMALQLSASPQNLLTNRPNKCCSEYFKDFYGFLLDTLHLREYHKLVAYPPKQSNRLAHCLLDTVHALCRGLVIHQRGYLAMVPVIRELLEETLMGREQRRGESLWKQLTDEHKALMKLMRGHPNGPLDKVLEVIENGEANAFEPLRQENMPTTLFMMYLQERRISSIRLPSPTTQEFVHRAHVVEEFNGFLRACESDSIPRHHLLINFQDRTSWRELARCKALEALPRASNFRKHLTVVTLATDTEFYHQLAPYHDEKHADRFKQRFMEQLSGEQSGYYFSTELRKQLFPEFAEALMDVVHRIFFSDKNVLSRQERLNFIQIYTFFFILKLIDIIKPDSFSMTCKDAIDAGGASNALFFAFFQLLHHDRFSKQDLDCLHYILNVPAILIRERLMLPDCYNRAVAALKAFEAVREEFGKENFPLVVKEAFEDFYETPVLQAQVVTPKM